MLDCGAGRALRLRSMRAGTVVGELGVYADTKATASIVADSASTLYFLSCARLAEMEAAEPALAGALHRFIAAILGERLITATDTIRALRD